ncbi:MAG: hypothetical protein A2Z91_09400 [Deltaproteobacteria bacterium GWA2_38_16]|nr:MAG: hypothetical protein A2Z91_09400 [Deltaproteobacteria bacterium GWA2_38_16]OGQ02490.1 MAG: hypothetical protein A3D19_09330 [Deltaproteobacteria bacterium RIFCSPHIGHO2_02_FULL_38_15]OGQ33219.1 MAG: hypothetical protein A3A72_04665 [Deltaproteobacteria bacterium RIFCSPLOWO2_01_FULL_38_9]HBQ21055.1 glycerol-3-phosphate dehydrogenase [Deltaproteobacteria bacterium]
MKKTIGVLGSGNWGTTLANLIAQRGQSVLLWSRNPSTVQEINHSKTNQKYTPGLKILDSIHATSSMKEVAESCELIFVVVPSKVFREVSQELGTYVSGDQILVSGTKGIENKTFRMMCDILKEETCCKKVGALSGPNIATEIIQGDPSGSVIASHYNEVIERVMGALQQPLFKMYGNKDVKGVEIGGALKNIIAIASGIATGLHLGNNSKAFLISRGIVEISRYGKFFGADPKTFFGLSGIGDLMATCYSEHSRNNTFGRKLASGQTMDDILKASNMVIEGIYTVQAVQALAQKFNIFMPISAGIYRVLYENANLKEVIRDLMSVRVTYESEDFKEDVSHITHMLVNKYPIPEHFL